MKFSLSNHKLFSTTLRKDVFLTFSVQVILMVALFIVNKILSVKLGVDGYGEFSIIKRSASVFAYAMVGGMSIALPRYLSIYRAKQERQTENSFFVASLLLVFSFSLIVLLLAIFFKEKLLVFLFGLMPQTHYLPVLLCYAFSLCMSSYLFSFFRGKGSYLMFSISQIVVQVINLVGCFFTFVSLSFVFYFWSIAVLGYTFFHIVREIYKFQIEIKEIFQHILPSFKQLAKYGTPRMSGDFLLFSFAAYPLIVINQKFGMTNTGLFSAAVTLNTMITPLFAFLGTILLQRTSEGVATHQLAPIYKIINKMIPCYAVLAGLAALAITFFAKWLLPLFYESSYIEATSFCAIVSWSLIPNALYLLLRNPLDALSVFPHNTINLFVSFLVLVIGLYLANTILQFCYVYLLSYCVMALLSICSWFYVKIKVK
ncbi:MAG: lipopolysaccharide biosynthesis protein [Bacteroidales bacterium]|jgi:O-antigen/teichoic acid export membrane protein|nr:lipopolysaccharide biosynthesis protein [Bacteroidales bacterium]